MGYTAPQFPCVGQCVSNVACSMTYQVAFRNLSHLLLSRVAGQRSFRVPKKSDVKGCARLQGSCASTETVKQIGSHLKCIYMCINDKVRLTSKVK